MIHPSPVCHTKHPGPRFLFATTTTFITRNKTGSSAERDHLLNRIICETGWMESSRCCQDLGVPPVPLSALNLGFTSTWSTPANGSGSAPLPSAPLPLQRHELPWPGSWKKPLETGRRSPLGPVRVFFPVGYGATSLVSPGRDLGHKHLNLCSEQSLGSRVPQGGSRGLVQEPQLPE